MKSKLKATLTPCVHTELSHIQCSEKSFGEVCDEFMSHKRNGRKNQVPSPELEQIQQHLNHAIYFFGSRAFPICLLHGNAWRNYFDWNRKQRPDVEPTQLQRERGTIVDLFKFALNKGYISNVHMPVLYKVESVEERFNRWIIEQRVEWAAFTLHFPFFTKEEDWRKPLNEFFVELERYCVKSAIKKKRKKSKEPLMHRVAFMGGDKKSGVVLHCQGLIELMDDDVNALAMKMEKSWKSVVRRHRDRFPAGIYEEEIKWLPSARIWVEKFEVPEDKEDTDYLEYLGRLEGDSLLFGVQKIVISSATALKPPSD